MDEKKKLGAKQRGCLQGLLCSALCVDVCSCLLCVRCSRKDDICHVGSFVTMVTYRKQEVLKNHWSHGNNDKQLTLIHHKAIAGQLLPCDNTSILQAGAHCT